MMNNWVKFPMILFELWWVLFVWRLSVIYQSVKWNCHIQATGNGDFLLYIFFSEKLIKANFTSVCKSVWNLLEDYSFPGLTETASKFDLKSKNPLLFHHTKLLSSVMSNSNIFTSVIKTFQTQSIVFSTNTEMKKNDIDNCFF